MEREAQTNILFLDACRDNPLARNLARAMGTRSTDIGRGLAHVESGVGTLISFSTRPGNVALDGTGRNSPFAGALVKQLSSTNDDLFGILVAVRNDVMRETQRKQVPWEHSALTGQFYFSSAPVQAQSNEAERAWRWVKNTTDQSVLVNFIKEFGDTRFGAEAKTRLAELRKQQVAITTPPSSPKPQPQDQPSFLRTMCQRHSHVLHRAAALYLWEQLALPSCPDCPEMVVIPAGTFIMGSPPNEAERNNDEGPQLKVTIAKPFAVGKFRRPSLNGMPASEVVGATTTNRTIRAGAAARAP